MKKRKLNKKNGLLLLIIIFFFSLFLFSLYKIFGYVLDNHENRNIQKSLIDKTVEIDESQETVQYSIDFKHLKALNTDVVAYIKVEGTNIDYIVVKGQDNEYYLSHNFYKKRNVSGWIYADYHNNFDGNDKNIIIYGHNTHDNSMFGSLHNVLASEWQENVENHKILLVTELGIFYYQVFSIYTIEPEEYYLSTSFLSDENFNTFIQTINSRSIYDFDVDISDVDQILTLSSCIKNGKERVVLHAKLISQNV